MVYILSEAKQLNMILYYHVICADVIKCTDYNFINLLIIIYYAAINLIFYHTGIIL